MTVRNLYKTLGLSRQATPAQIKARWRELASDMHPDRLGSTREANDAFASVTEAYAIISEPKRRQAYHAEIDLLSDSCASCDGRGAVFKQKGFAARVEITCTACEGCGRKARVSELPKRRRK